MLSTSSGLPGEFIDSLVPSDLILLLLFSSDSLFFRFPCQKYWYMMPDMGVFGVYRLNIFVIC